MSTAIWFFLLFFFYKISLDSQGAARVPWRGNPRTAFAVQGKKNSMAVSAVSRCN